MWTVSKSKIKVTKIIPGEFYYDSAAEESDTKRPDNEWTFETEVVRTVKRELKDAKERKYDQLRVFTTINYRKPGSAEDLLRLRLTTVFETKHFLLHQVDKEMWFYLNETSLGHCHGWYALKSIGTVFENHIMPTFPIRTMKGLEKNMKRIYGDRQ